MPENGVDVGRVAGNIWRYLARKGKSPLSTLPRALDIHPTLLLLGAGWLAREGKVVLLPAGREIFVDLTTHERDAARKATDCIVPRV